MVQGVMGIPVGMTAEIPAGMTAEIPVEIRTVKSGPRHGASST